MRKASSGGSNLPKPKPFTDIKQPGSVKIVVCGDGAVGKTSMLASYVTGKFPEEYIPTVFENHELDRHVDGQVAHLKLWDTAGQEEYQSLRVLSYPETDVFVVVFSVAHRTSFTNIGGKWMKELRKHCPQTPILVVGAKSDLRQSPSRADFFPPMLSKDEYEERVCRELEADGYIECSAVTQENLTMVFDEATRLGRKYIDKMKKLELEQEIKGIKGGLVSTNGAMSPSSSSSGKKNSCVIC